MRLIKKIEINYLRSLYSATLDNLTPLNVVFGRNDSGKSNFLRALNLFFNEMTEPKRDFDFALDMSDVRKQEARDAKGRQFIWIKLTFDVPENYRNSLGAEIAVKRQWNRDEDWSETVFPALEGPGQHARFTRFMNDIDYTYIPAIKDLNLYADLIERMYGAAADTEELRTATDTFVAAIGAQTVDLSRQLSSLFGGPARLAAPTEMSRLFRDLDFAHGADGHSLLRQKGDGIKARHLPELLRYINAKESRKKIFLWGFEEPENSLDFGAAESEARRFAEFSGRNDTQIFITSHSPAFYLAGDDNDIRISRFFITKQTRAENGSMTPSNAATRIDDWQAAEAKMEKAGLLQLPFVIKRLREQRDTLDSVQAEVDRLKVQLAELNRPTLFVEGRHDVSMFEESFARMDQDFPVSVRALGGTPQSTDTLVSAIMEQGGLNPAAPTMLLFDNDKAGRGAYRKLNGAAPQANPVNFGGRNYAWALVKTEEFSRFMRRHGIITDQAFFTAEFLFPGEESAAICLDLVNNSNHPEIAEWRLTINGDYWQSLGQIRCKQLADAQEGSVDWFFARGVPNCLKQRFSEEIRNRGIDTGHLDQIVRTVQDTLRPGFEL